MPPWGTQEDPRTPAAPPSVEHPGPRFVVLVEQSTGNGDNIVWSVDPEPWSLPEGMSHSQACATALDVARNLQPKHPWSKGQRRIYRLAPDAYLVTVDGATKTFHFRVSVAEAVL